MVQQKKTTHFLKVDEPLEITLKKIHNEDYYMILFNFQQKYK